MRRWVRGIRGAMPLAPSQNSWPLSHTWRKGGGWRRGGVGRMYTLQHEPTNLKRCRGERVSRGGEAEEKSTLTLSLLHRTETQTTQPTRWG